MLFSTMSFTVNKHFCGKILMGQSVFSKIEACCPHMQHSSENGEDKKKSCCSDKEVVLEAHHEGQISFHNSGFHQQFIVVALVYSYFNLFENLPEQVVPFKNYSPPLLVYNIHILDETFLI